MLLGLFACAWLSCLGLAFALPGRLRLADKRQHLLQDIVTWDANSLLINGGRLMIFSGEFHPFRLPVPSLWLDIFQKVKALGFNTISFYVDWALVEGKQGNFSAEGVFDLQPFFDAAKTAGIYLIARPGPYINAESSGGGLPGWLQRIKGHLRTRDPEFMNAQAGYISKIGPIIAEAQITNGGPVILVQPENEYSHPEDGTSLDPLYMQEVEDYYRQAGIVVPLINNDGLNYGNFAPGTGVGQVDIYSHDSYPLGFDCSQPYNWTGDYFPTNFYTVHEEQSPTTPYSISEFQGGSFDPWGGYGVDNCATLLNNEFERVYNKNDFSFGVKIFNLYMIYGGTNWGNLGHPGGYTSYDYGSAITEDRTLTREKYSELKLEANFLKVSPAYLVADVHNVTNTSYTSTPAISVTRLSANTTAFWVVRHSDHTSVAATEYTLQLPTSVGMTTIPQNGSLLLNGRDSKILVTDYMVGSFWLLYSSAEIFTWKDHGSRTVLILYGGPGETHEAAFKSTSKPTILEGAAAVKTSGNIATINWRTSSTRTIIQLDTLYIYLLDRNSAYDYWVLDLSGSNNYSTAESVIVKAGYLLRTAQIQGGNLQLTGDINRTTTVEVISAPTNVSSVSFNGRRLPVQRQPSTGILTAEVEYKPPALHLPDLASLDWKVVDSLPEIQPTYNDSRWTPASNTYTNNTTGWNLTTPTSLYASDYGYHTGSLLFRGWFTANGNETTFSVHTQGGTAYGASVWVDDTFLGSWPGNSVTSNYTQCLQLPNLTPGTRHVFTVVIDDMGYDENGVIGADNMKNPRGILDYSLTGHNASDITWKVTGNLGGEDYVDRTRGPLNEGGLYAERQGWHLPKPPAEKFASGNPLVGIQRAGVAFYTASFTLDMPEGYDIPLAFIFTNSSSTLTTAQKKQNQNQNQNYRVQLYVNGYQFGKYVNNIGPQTTFPVPEGILNYHGINYIALSLWALDKEGARLAGLRLALTGHTQAVLSGYGRPVALSPMPEWEERRDAY
ncbi:hypothetical protein VTN96DRAFT_6116 [Rasamsonia emersonii]